MYQNTHFIGILDAKEIKHLIGSNANFGDGEEEFETTPTQESTTQESSTQVYNLEFLLTQATEASSSTQVSNLELLLTHVVPQSTPHPCPTAKRPYYLRSSSSCNMSNKDFASMLQMSMQQQQALVNAQSRE